MDLEFEVVSFPLDVGYMLELDLALVSSTPLALATSFHVKSYHQTLNHLLHLHGHENLHHRLFISRTHCSHHFF